MKATAERSRSCLVDLPGRPGETQAVNARSVTDAVQQLRAGEEAVTTAGSTGAIVVWKVGKEWHCEFMRHLATLDAAKFKYLAAVAEWLKEWWPKAMK